LRLLIGLSRVKKKKGGVISRSEREEREERERGEREMG
jgi:hypothetical protein